MKYKVRAVKDVDMGIGDRKFKSSAGETLELSSQGVEIALSHLLGGAYELVEEIPETDAEKTRVKAKQEKKVLMKQPRAKLERKAERLGVEGAGELNKEPLAEAIVEAKGETKGGGKK